MDLHEYQVKARTTAMYPESARVNYPILGLVGEAGELANTYKKVIRDDDGELTVGKYNALVAELGDVLWYIAQIATDLDISLDEVAINNLSKLADRKERGVIGGSGDTR